MIQIEIEIFMAVHKNNGSSPRHGQKKEVSKVNKQRFHCRGWQRMVYD